VQRQHGGVVDQPDGVRHQTLRPPLGQSPTADIRDWVQRWNENRKPFTWHKIADEIGDRLAGSCTGINNSHRFTRTEH
jgi:hypothetical protein